MASRRYAAAIFLLAICCLDASSIVAVVAAAVAWHPPRYESYKLEKGPVFYEAYYPDTRDSADQREHQLDRNAVLERSYQVPFEERFAYSARRVPTNGSFVITDNARAPSDEADLRGAIMSGRDYDVANKIAPFRDERPIVSSFGGDDSDQNANIEDISKLVRRAISRDLENWSALERYLERAANQERLQSGMYSEENIRGGGIQGDDGYGFRVDQRSYDSPEQQPEDFGAPDESDDDRQRPTYLERVVSENTVMNAAASDARIASSPINVISESSQPLADNIFQPRPQVIRYTFFKKPTARPDVDAEATIVNSTPRNYGDNLIREEIADSRGGRKEKSVKVTSIEVSELPRRKTRHHHGEWPKRDYSARRRRSQSTDRPVV